jgi:hypothetical protein
MDEPTTPLREAEDKEAAETGLKRTPADSQFHEGENQEEEAESEEELIRRLDHYEGEIARNEQRLK